MGKKSLAKNSIFVCALNSIFAEKWIKSSYVSHVLLPAGVGRVSYANTIAAYFVLIASLGLPSYGVKAIAQSNVDKEQRSRTFLELFLINFAATVLCTIAYYLFVNYFPHFADRKPLFNVMGLMLILNIFNIDWFYQGMEEYVYISVRSFIVKIASFGLMLLFVKDERDYLIYALILCIATAGNNLWNAWNLRKYISLEGICHSRQGKVADTGLHIGKHMRPVMILLASSIATDIYTMLDSVMLEYYYGETNVGYYSNAVKIVRMTYTVVIALVAVFYPRISMCYKQKDYKTGNALINRGTQILLLLALPCAAGLLATAEYVVPLLFGRAFDPAIPTLRILSVLILIFSIAYFLGHIILTATGMEKMILRATVTGAVVNVCANFALIPVLKQDGAAIASVLSEAVVTVILLVHAKKYYILKFSRHYILTLTIALLAMLAVTFGLEQLITNRVWMILFVIAVAGVVYFAVLIILRNEIVEELWKKVRVYAKRRQG